MDLSATSKSKQRVLVHSHSQDVTISLRLNNIHIWVVEGHVMWGIALSGRVEHCPAVRFNIVPTCLLSFTHLYTTLSIVTNDWKPQLGI